MAQNSRQRIEQTKLVMSAPQVRDKNRLLAVLPAAERERLDLHLEPVSMALGEVVVSVALSVVAGRSHLEPHRSNSAASRTNGDDGPSAEREARSALTDRLANG